MKKAHKYKRLKKRKSIFKNKFFWFSILTPPVIAGLFYFFLFSPVFQIKEIKAENVLFSDKQEVEQTIEQNIGRRFLFLETKSIFLFKKRVLEKEILEKFPAVKELEIVKELPASVLVKLTERRPAAVAFFDSDYFFVDEQGIAFKRSKPEFVPKDLPLICFREELSLGKFLINEKNLDAVVDISDMLMDKTGLEQEYYSIMDNGIELDILNENFVVYFNPEGDIIRQLDDLALVLAESAKKIEEYVDLRFDKVFLK